MNISVSQKLTRKLFGTVTSVSMLKTVTVLVERRVRHPLLGKIVVKSKKFHADTSGLNLELGNKVEIEECRPISKTKAWRVVSVI